MRKYLLLIATMISLHAFSQDTTMNDLTKGMEGTNEKKPVKIFQSERVINANTTEIVPKGRMDFKVTHNFDDAAGVRGGIDNFFGLDNSTDIRIGFHLGLTNRLNLNIAHLKGDGIPLRTDTVGSNKGLSNEILTYKLYEVALKYQLLRQLENDPSHPISLSLFVNTIISAVSPARSGVPPNDPIVPNTNRSFYKFGDRISNVFQMIVAKKIGKISVQLNPTYVHYGYVPTYDEPSTFAVGGAIRVPVSKSISLIVDYFHSFISDTKKANYYNAKNIKFHDPLGVGLEITTAGHVFHLNFTNATAISENQMLPYNTSSWSKGQFRWGFNLSRRFSLWKEKEKKK